MYPELINQRKCTIKHKWIAQFRAIGILFSSSTYKPQNQRKKLQQYEGVTSKTVKKIFGTQIGFVLTSETSEAEFQPFI